MSDHQSYGGHETTATAVSLISLMAAIPIDLAFLAFIAPKGQSIGDVVAASPTLCLAGFGAIWWAIGGLWHKSNLNRQERERAAHNERVERERIEARDKAIRERNEAVAAAEARRFAEAEAERLAAETARVQAEAESQQRAAEAAARARGQARIVAHDTGRGRARAG